MMSPPLDYHGLRIVLEGAGLRCTAQRGGLRLLGHSEHHPTAEEVYQAVKTTIPKISLATVYKALETLVACGLAKPECGRRAGAATTPGATIIITSGAFAPAPSRTWRPLLIPT